MRAWSICVALLCMTAGAWAAPAAAPGKVSAGQLQPDWGTVYREALGLMRWRKYAEAAAKLEECVTREGVLPQQMVHMLTSLGQCQLHRRDHAGAEATFRRAAGKNRRDYRPHYWLGKSRLLQDDIEGALKHFDEALRLNQGAHEVYWERAQIAIGKGDVEAELGELESFLRCGRGYAGGRTAWAKTRLFREDVRQLAGAIDRTGNVVRPVKTVLVTGFGPFGIFAVNPSWEGVKGLDGATIAGAQVHAVLLPVHFLGSTTAMQEAVQRVKPDLVVAFGVGGRSHFGIETIARRPRKRQKPGSAGSPEQALDLDDPGLPATYLTRLPALYMIECLSRGGVPVSAHVNAGGYVCNHIFYVVAHLLRATDIPSGFVHVPRYATDDKLLAGIEASRHRTAMRLIVEATIEGVNAGYTDDPLTRILIDVLSQASGRYRRSYQRAALLEALGTGKR